MSDHSIRFLYLSQEDLIEAGAFDLPMAIEAARQGLLRYRQGRILFPDKIVQIFDEATQDRINCLPATLLDEKVCGVKWVSVFPGNPVKFGVQNLSAITVLSGIEKGFPLCVMDGTLCSNIRVAAMGALAAESLSRRDSRTIGFIGAGEQARMHLLGMKSVRPSLDTCYVAAKYAHEEQDFIRTLQLLLPDVRFIACDTQLRRAVEDSDIVVTATSAQAPLLKAAWIRPGTFYSHIGGWEEEFAVPKLADKIVCDDWETVKHRTQTLSRAYKAGEITDRDIYGNLVDLLDGSKPGRERDDEFTYFNAVGLAYIDVSIAWAMYTRAKAAGVGTEMAMQRSMIFEKPDLKDKIRL